MSSVDRGRQGGVASGGDGDDAAAVGNLWAIVQAHLDKYGVREAAFARKLGTGPQTLNSWKRRGVRQLPSFELLQALARETSATYDEVLEAALADAGYRRVRPDDPRPTRTDRSA